MGLQMIFSLEVIVREVTEALARTDRHCLQMLRGSPLKVLLAGRIRTRNDEPSHGRLARRGSDIVPQAAPVPVYVTYFPELEGPEAK